MLFDQQRSKTVNGSVGSISSDVKDEIRKDTTKPNVKVTDFLLYR